MSHYNDPEPTTITTCDGHIVKVGDTVHNYYNCMTGEIRDIDHGDVANDGWARLTDGAGNVNGERMCLNCTICGYKTPTVSAPMEEVRADYIAVEADTELVRVKDLKPGDLSPFFGTFLKVEDHPRRSNSHPDENGGCYYVRAYFVDFDWHQLDFMRGLTSHDDDGRPYWSLQGNDLAGFRRVVPAL